MQGFARINWKDMAALTKREPKLTWAWQKPSTRSVVKFIPNPSTTPDKLVRIKTSRGGTKLFRAPKAKVALVKTDKNTAYTGDRNSCTVNALSIVANVPWVVAYNALRNAGRRDSRGFNEDSAIKTRKIKGFAFKSILRKPTTLRKFIAAHPVGRFYCDSATHAFAVIHGKVYDRLSKMGGNRVVLHAYTIKPDGRE